MNQFGMTTHPKKVTTVVMHTVYQGQGEGERGWAFLLGGTKLADKNNVPKLWEFAHTL